MGEPCEDEVVTNKTMFGGLMLKTGIVDDTSLKLHNIANRSYVEFSFKRPVLIKGWSVRGKEGGMLGNMVKRRGFIDSYEATYIDEGGEVELIENPETKDNEFIAKGNLARPEEISEVTLDPPGIRTKRLRLAPSVWSGTPFMAVSLFICRRPSDVQDTEKPLEEPYESLPALEVEEGLKGSRSEGVFGSIMDATKSAFGIKVAKTTEGEESPHSTPTLCKKPLGWRYGKKPTPVDQFSARGNPYQAWRAILGVNYTPYLFPKTNAHTHKHKLLEILFKQKSRVDAVKMAGLGEAGPDLGVWGALTKFSLLYKNQNTDDWVYYADGTGTPRVFEAGNKTRENSHKLGVFHLPAPLYTNAIGIFPHSWVNKPYLAIDLLACYIKKVGADYDEVEVPLEETPQPVKESGRQPVTLRVAETKTTETETFKQSESPPEVESVKEEAVTKTETDAVRKNRPDEAAPKEEGDKDEAENDVDDADQDKGQDEDTVSDASKKILEMSRSKGEDSVKADTDNEGGKAAQKTTRKTVTTENAPNGKVTTKEEVNIVTNTDGNNEALSDEKEALEELEKSEQELTKPGDDGGKKWVQVKENDSKTVVEKEEKDDGDETDEDEDEAEEEEDNKEDEEGGEPGEVLKEAAAIEGAMSNVDKLEQPKGETVTKKKVKGKKGARKGANIKKTKTKITKKMEKKRLQGKAKKQAPRKAKGLSQKVVKKMAKKLATDIQKKTKKIVKKKPPKKGKKWVAMKRKKPKPKKGKKHKKG